MMARRTFALLAAIAIATSAPVVLQSQGTRGTVDSATSAVFGRAQRMVAEGQGDQGRALVQAQLEAAPTGSPRYVEALYWRALLAANPSESERDLRRLVIEYPLSARAADALFRLGQLELAQGDRQQAITHFDRLVKEHGDSPLRPRASYWMARAWFDEGSVPTGCARLGDATRTSPADSIELRNQIAFYAQRCTGVDTMVQATAAARRTGQGGVIIAGPPPGGRVATPSRSPARSGISPIIPSAPPRDTTTRVAMHRDSVPAATTPPVVRESVTTRPPIVRESVTTQPPRVRDSATTKPPVVADSVRTTRSASPVTRPAPVAPAPTRASGQWTVQVGAYKTRAEAEQLRKTVAGRGYDARIWESADWFRVRVGRFATHGDAIAESERMRKQGIAVYVTEAEPK